MMWRFHRGLQQESARNSENINTFLSTPANSPNTALMQPNHLQKTRFLEDASVLLLSMPGADGNGFRPSRSLHNHPVSSGVRAPGSLLHPGYGCGRDSSIFLDSILKVNVANVWAQPLIGIRIWLFSEGIPEMVTRGIECLYTGRSDTL